MTAETKDFETEDFRTLTQRERVVCYLDALQISFEITEHPAVYTIEEMNNLGIGLQGDVCKNLFLRDAKGRRNFLVVLKKDKRADLESIRKQLGCSKLSFASPERLERFLGLRQGEVTPLGVLNDRNVQVEVVLDKDLMGNPHLGVHPNENTSTLWISFDDLLHIIEYHGNPIHFLEI